jgi:mono/diheme cytochrome c family protein
MKISIGLMIACITFTSAHAATNDDEVVVPFSLAKGKALFDENCSACHGLQLNGTDKGPPMLHGFYKPSHHGDAAFYRAALQGVRGHHWPFGDMPPVAGMTREKMDSILPYIRFYQQQKKLY